MAKESIISKIFRRNKNSKQDKKAQNASETNLVDDAILNTSGYEVDGKNVYTLAENVKGHLNLVMSSSEFEKLESSQRAELAKNMIKAQMGDRHIAEIYAKNVEFSSIDDFLDSLEEVIENANSDSEADLDGVTYLPEDFFIVMFSNFIRDMKKINDPKIKNVQSATEFLDRLTNNSRFIESTRGTQRIPDGVIFKAFSPFFGGDEDYEIAVEVSKRLKQFKYQRAFDDGSREFKIFAQQLVENVKKDDWIKLVARFLADEENTAKKVSAGEIFDLLRDNAQKKGLTNFDEIMPIYEWAVSHNKGLHLLFSSADESTLRSQFASEYFGVPDIVVTNSDAITALGSEREYSEKEIEDKRRELIREQIKEKVTRYAKIGTASDDVLEKIFNIANGYNKNLTYEQFLSVVEKNDNLRAISEHISFLSDAIMVVGYDENEQPIRGDSAKEKGIKVFEAMFPKTRLQALPGVNAFSKMTINLAEKFNVKVWNKFASLPIFAHDDDTKKALVEMIAVFGLFETDPNVEERCQKVYKLMSEYDIELSSELIGLVGNEHLAKDKELYFDEIERTKYYVGQRANVPVEFQDKLERNNIFSEKYMSRLKQFSGNYGKRLNDYLFPYKKEGDKYILKPGVEFEGEYPSHIRESLKSELTQDEYNELLADPVIKDLIEPVHATTDIVYRLKPTVKGAKRTETEDEYLRNYNGGGGRLCYDSIHRMFDGLDKTYNPDFYKLVMSDFDIILDKNRLQSSLRAVQQALPKAKVYYAERGKTEIDIFDMVSYLEKVIFDYSYGRKEFAEDVKNAGVRSNESYSFYESLLPKLEARKKTTIPRHNNTYIYKAEDGKEYTVLTKILRLDDPLNMLVGESNFSNCCQRFVGAGSECMEHASTSKDGGIFATFLIGDDGKPQMLTQSWIWTNESKLCFDNVEATDLITGKDGKQKRLFQDIATFGIVSASHDLMEASKVGIENYIKTETAKIMRSKLSEQEKKVKLSELEEIRKRQVIKTITVGEGYDDLNVRETFKEIEDNAHSYGPKGYSGYRDSKEGQQHIILSTEKGADIDWTYEDVPIFRDERRVENFAGNDIPQWALKKITDIEKQAHKSDMIMYSTEEDKPKLFEPDDLAMVYGVSSEYLRVVMGEDWYMVYTDDGNEIYIADIARDTPRIEDESKDQTNEMNHAFNEILKQSVKVSEDGEVENIKEISADMREDTSYLLYLINKRRGIIEQVGEDKVYKFGEKQDATEFDEKEQAQILESFKEIENGGNDELRMHSVRFRVGERILRKLLEENQEDVNE